MTITPRYVSLLAAAALAAPLAAAAADIVVPDQLQVPTGQKLALDVRGVGVQIYVCSATDGGSYEWRLKAPEADLFDQQGRKVGKHYAGPTWEANDGSKVVGAVKAHQDDPHGAAIPWLLLNAKSTEGAGVFGKVDAIQRLATDAGLAPKDGCAQAQLGQEARVAYQAVYRFYSAN